VGLPSPSALGNRNNLHPEAILTSRNVVPHAARKGRHGSTAIVAIAMEMIAIATGLNARCSPRPAPSAAKAPKSRFNLAVISRFTAAIATEKSDLVDKRG